MCFTKSCFDNNFIYFFFTILTSHDASAINIHVPPYDIEPVPVEQLVLTF